MSRRFSKVLRKVSKHSKPLSLTCAIHRRIARRPDFLECSLSRIRVSFSRRLYPLRSKGEASNSRSSSACSSGARCSRRFRKAHSTPFSPAYCSLVRTLLSAFSSILGTDEGDKIGMPFEQRDFIHSQDT